MKKPYERVMVLDFETAWDRQVYTLSKMTTEQYIRDKRFKAWGCSYKYLNDPQEAVWIPGFQLQKFFDSIDWSTTAALAHNAMFDLSILAWVYGHHPCFIFDSLSMARALYGVNAGNSLAKLAERFELPPKGKAVHSTDGMLDTLPADVEKELAGYCCHDVFLAEQVFLKMLPYPPKELRLIDMTLRMYTQPKLELDKALLIEAIHEEQDARRKLMVELQLEEGDLASNERFAEILRLLGVEPPMKISKTTGEQAYALAKNDAMFQALVNHEREDVALLCEARLAVKSTGERTRAQRFLDIARRGALPVPLSYYAAHTGRWGGTQQINLQNLPRGSKLRGAIVAPEGHVLVVCDLSQIEPRVLAWLADYKEMLQIFNSGVDPYALFGARMFGIPGMTKESHPALRQSAKSAMLGCGFGLGWPNFAGQLLVGFLGAPPVRYDTEFAKQMGMSAEKARVFLEYAPNVEKAIKVPHLCTNEEMLTHCIVAKEIIDIYRETAAPVKELWAVFDAMLKTCLAGDKQFQYKFLKFSKERIGLPNGMFLRYPNLTSSPDEKGRAQYKYEDKGTKKVYGSRLVENCVQSVARIVMTDGLLRVQERYPVLLSVHDEGVFLVPEAEAQEAQKWILEQMVQEPRWMRGIPLAADIGAAKRYGEAKQ